MPVDISVQIPAGVVMGLYRHFLPPIVVFGSPVQRCKNETESWWHIPVTLRRKWGIGAPSLPSGCQVYLDRHSDEGGFNEAIRMRWGDAIFSETGDTATLVVGEPLLVPIVFRQENNEGKAYITDARYLLGKDKPYPLAPDRKKIRFRLRVKVRGETFACSHPYIVRVPRVSSNGHFTCEVEYEGEGSRKA
jgi:hypothetical protein